MRRGVSYEALGSRWGLPQAKGREGQIAVYNFKPELVGPFCFVRFRLLRYDQVSRATP